MLAYDALMWNVNGGARRRGVSGLGKGGMNLQALADSQIQAANAQIASGSAALNAALNKARLAASNAQQAAASATAIAQAIGDGSGDQLASQAQAIADEASSQVSDIQALSDALSAQAQADRAACSDTSRGPNLPCPIGNQAAHDGHLAFAQAVASAGQQAQGLAAKLGQGVSQITSIAGQLNSVKRRYDSAQAAAQAQAAQAAALAQQQAQRDADAKARQDAIDQAAQARADARAAADLAFQQQQQKFQQDQAQAAADRQAARDAAAQARQDALDQAAQARADRQALIEAQLQQQAAGPPPAYGPPPGYYPPDYSAYGPPPGYPPAYAPAPAPAPAESAPEVSPDQQIVADDSSDQSTMFGYLETHLGMGNSGMDARRRRRRLFADGSGVVRGMGDVWNDWKGALATGSVAPSAPSSAAPKGVDTHTAATKLAPAPEGPGFFERLFGSTTDAQGQAQPSLVERLVTAIPGAVQTFRGGGAPPPPPPSSGPSGGTLLAIAGGLGLGLLGLKMISSRPSGGVPRGATPYQRTYEPMRMPARSRGGRFARA